MSLFGNSRDSAFDLLGQAREKILSQSPKIPPPGTLARPGRKAPDGAPVPRFSGGPVASPVIERAVQEFLDIDGDPLLVIDDELDVTTITPEEGQLEDEPARVLGVRQDTAIVFGIGLVLVIAIAYLAGRTAKPTDAPVAKADAPPSVTKAVLQPPPQAPAVPGSPLGTDTPAATDDGSAATPASAPASGATKPAAAPTDDAAPATPLPAPEARTPAAGTWEIWIVTTGDAKAEKVKSFLNDDAGSPIAARKTLQAYVKKTSHGSQVRIRGLDKEDKDLLAQVQAMKDPTGGGTFQGAVLRSVKS